MSLSTKVIVLKDGPPEIQIKQKLKIVLVSVPVGQESDILHSTPKWEDAHATMPQMVAQMMINIMTTMLIASSRVIFI